MEIYSFPGSDCPAKKTSEGGNIASSSESEYRKVCVGNECSPTASQDSSHAETNRTISLYVQPKILSGNEPSAPPYTERIICEDSVSYSREVNNSATVAYSKNSISPCRWQPNIIISNSNSMDLCPLCKKNYPSSLIAPPLYDNL